MDKERLLSGMSYAEYVALVSSLIAQNKTTGPNQSDDFLAYTKLNQSRMRRGEKQAKLTEQQTNAIKSLKKPQIWMLLTEAWCGDAAANLPMINEVASASEHIQLRLLLRDENLDIMDQYLTNGGRSIPKLVIFDAESMQEIAQWGPRPAFLQNWLMENKKTEALSKSELTEAFQKWYAKDKGQTLAEELISLLNA